MEESLRQSQTTLYTALDAAQQGVAQAVRFAADRDRAFAQAQQVRCLHTCTHAHLRIFALTYTHARTDIHTRRISLPSYVGMSRMCSGSGRRDKMQSVMWNVKGRSDVNSLPHEWQI